MRLMTSFVCREFRCQVISSAKKPDWRQLSSCPYNHPIYSNICFVFRSPPCSYAYTNLARMSQAAQVFRIVQSVLQIHVYIITVRLQRLELPVTQNILQGITAAGTFPITVDDNLFFTVDRTPDISFVAGVSYLHLALDLVAVNDGIL